MFVRVHIHKIKVIKMEIDKETQPKYINIVIDDNLQYLRSLKEQANEDGQNDEKEKKLSLTLDKHSFEMEEYYFDKEDATITISGNMKSTKGESWVSFSIPLSDKILINILEYSTEKLDKLKTALETLK